MSSVSEPQISEALQKLARFRDNVHKQRAQHVLPYLALRFAGVSTTTPVRYTEADDFEFWNTFLRVRAGDQPYFDPIACSFRIASHPHSNVATARKGTFWKSWAAAHMTSSPSSEAWTLDPDYVAVIEKKVLSKAGRVTRIPALPLAAFLLRAHDVSDYSDLLTRFKAVFHLDAEEYERLFEDASLAAPFTDNPLSDTDVVKAIFKSGVVRELRESRTDFADLAIGQDDRYVNLALTLINEDAYAGVILVGPPGTSKSWYAHQIALHLTDGESSHVFKVQFHPSYQYENFVEGYSPTSAGGFELKKQVVRRVAALAEQRPEGTFVIIIDELSRSDPARVFGELLTYMEKSRRGETFLLSSGDEFSLPENIVFVATMNSLDKSVTEIDDAFDRRMGKIELAPDPELLLRLLRENGTDDQLSVRISSFLSWVSVKYPLGHTFFLNVRDEESLRRLWETQLRFIFDKRFRHEPNVFREILDKFIEITGVQLDR
jgi:5-methylcytosine-specific restriction enzyme B